MLSSPGHPSPRVRSPSWAACLGSQQPSRGLFSWRRQGSREKNRSRHLRRPWLRTGTMSHALPLWVKERHTATQIQGEIYFPLLGWSCHKFAWQRGACIGKHCGHLCRQRPAAPPMSAISLPQRDLWSLASRLPAGGDTQTFGGCQALALTSANP